jgi:hypothetical protein
MRDKITRLSEFEDFVTVVKHHIKTYTIPQYGDYPNDQMTTASIFDIKMNLLRYVNRIGSNSRGKNEAIRDTYKFAHYAAILWGKYTREEGLEQTVESRWIIYNEKTNKTEPSSFFSEDDAVKFKKTNKLDNDYKIFRIEL